MTRTRCLTCILLLVPLAACDGSLFGSAHPGGKDPAADNTAPLIFN